jgi:hypothetical protein
VKVVTIALVAKFVGLDRDRAFYPTALRVIGSYSVLFAAMSQSIHTVVLERTASRQAHRQTSDDIDTSRTAQA